MRRSSLPAGHLNCPTLLRMGTGAGFGRKLCPGSLLVSNLDCRKGLLGGRVKGGSPSSRSAVRAEVKDPLQFNVVTVNWGGLAGTPLALARATWFEPNVV